MKGMGYVSLFKKKLLALLRERVTSAYFLVSRIISCSSCRNALIVCKMKVAQSRWGLSSLRFLSDLDILSYITYPLGTRLPPITEETNICLPLYNFITGGCQSQKTRIRILEMYNRLL